LKDIEDFQISKLQMGQWTIIIRLCF